MKALTSLLALVALLTPGHVFGFARALDQASANDTIFVAARGEDTTTLTAFADESTRKWLILTPPNAALTSVSRVHMDSLDLKTRPILQQMAETDPCEAATLIEGGPKPSPKYAPLVIGADPPPVEPAPGGGLTATPWEDDQPPLFISSDMKSYLDEGWVLQVIELENAGDGVQFTFAAERFEVPPRPASGESDRGELTLITVAAARMEPGNFKSQLPPSNIEVKVADKDTQSVDRVLAAIFAEVDKNEKDAFITEFAMDLPRWDFNPPVNAFSSKEPPAEATVTRLRRFGDLGTFSSPIHLFPTFKMAGGDDVEVNGRLRSGGYSADKNDYRTRLVLRKPFDRSRPVLCQNPVWDTWVSFSIERLRASFDPSSTDAVRRNLFQKWLLTDVPEIYWTPEPEAEEPALEPEAATPSPVASQCGGCTSTESSATLALLVALFFTRRRTR